MPNVNHFNREAQNRTTNRENQVPNHNSTAQNQNTPPPFASAPPHTGQASKNVKTTDFTSNNKLKSYFSDSPSTY